MTISKTTGGVFDLSRWGVVSIAGPDAKDFLQRMSTCDLKKFDANHTKYCAFLNAKGHTLALGWLEQNTGVYLFHTAPDFSNVTATHLETFHFGENLEIKDVSLDFCHLGAWKSPVISERLSLPPANGGMEVATRVWGGIPIRCFSDEAWPELYWVTLPRKNAVEMMAELKKEGVELLSHSIFEVERIKHGIPLSGIEVTDKDIILEANFDRAVARNKGCYPGQEVVERIFTYGSVNRKLLEVHITWSHDVPQPPFSFFKADHTVGKVMSLTPLPGTEKEGVGLAYVQKNFWESKEKFSVDENATVELRQRK